VGGGNDRWGYYLYTLDWEKCGWLNTSIVLLSFILR
jgi:hypothetical protein